VVVDTVRDAIAEKLGPLLPALEAFARERGLDLSALAHSPSPTTPGQLPKP
jgi:riboflavin synthase